MGLARHSRLVFGQAIFAAVIVSLGWLGACSQQAPKAPGQLVIAIDTDMALPDQIDSIELVVTSRGQILEDVPLAVGPGLNSQPIPATLTLVAGPDPSATATIQVIGWKGMTQRTLRQATTTIPADRTGILRMPVQWLCDGTVRAAPDADAGLSYGSTCGEGQTCTAGSCATSMVDTTKIVTYEPQAVFGGGSAPALADGGTTGTCFDTVPCLVSGTVEQPDDQCTVALPTGGAGANVGLRVADDGICDTTGTICFVPLDGNSGEGWTQANGRIALPTAVCTKLRSGLIAGVYVSTTCATKSAANPVCGAWSSVSPPADAASPVPDAAAVPAEPTLLATATPDGGSATACCPLLADSTRLYTCVCNGTAPVQVVAIDPTSGAATSVSTFAPQFLRTQYAAVLAGGAVYWVDRTTSADAGTTCPVYGTPVGDGGGTGPAVAIVNGDVYDSADLLADANNLYTLADNLSGLPATASPVQLVTIARSTGQVTPLDTGGGEPVVQLTQDMSSVYVGVDTDVAAGADGGVQRTSRIVQFPKAGGPSTTLSQQTLTTSNPSFGGYIGLTDDGTSLFALSQAGPAADGTVDTKVLKIDTSSGTPSTVYDEIVGPTVSFRLLGAVSGAIVFSRDVTGEGGAAISESSVLVIPAGGGAPRIVASFAHDSPIFELQAPAFSPDSFWLNASGRVFRLPAAALQ